MYYYVYGCVNSYCYLRPPTRSLVPTATAVYSRAFLVVSAKEHRLPPVVADPLVFLALRVPALPVAAQNARLEVLNENGNETNHNNSVSYRTNE